MSDFSPAVDGLGRTCGACKRITEALLTHWGQVGHSSLKKQGLKNAGMDLARVTDVLFGTEANSGRDSQDSKDLQSISEAVIICKLRVEQRKHQQAAVDEENRQSQQSQVHVANSAPKTAVQQQNQTKVVANFNVLSGGDGGGCGGIGCCGGGGKEKTGFRL